MSDLNPLKFQVAIKDDATKQLEKIEKAFENLKNKTISVKVDGLSDLQNLLSALQHLQVQNIGKDVANGIKEATSGIKEEAQSAIRTALGNLATDLVAVKTAIQHDNFSAFSTRIEKCAEKVNALDEAFKKFHVTIGSDSGMKNFMTGLGEVIRNVRTTMGTLEAGKTGGLNGMANIYAKNVERIEDAMRRIRETRLILGNKLASANNVGLPIDNRHIYMLDAYMKKLEAIRTDEKLMNGKGWQTETFGNSFRGLLSQADHYIKYLDRQIQRQSVIETNQRKYNAAISEMQALLSRLSGASTSGNSLLLDTRKVDDAVSKLSQHISNVLNFDSKNFGNNHAVSELIAQWNQLKRTLSEVAREQEKINKTTENANNRQAAANAKQAQKDNEKWAESSRRANVEATKLEIQIRKLQDIESRGKKLGIDTNDLSISIAQMQKFVQLLRSIQSNPQAHGTNYASNVVNSAQFQNTIRLANEEAAAIKRSAREKEIAARATQQLSVEEQRLAQALQASTEKLHGQSQLLADLKSLATQYLGVWGGQQFLNNIIQIGGQLEMQRLSIGAILQNQAQANELFDNIKGLATQSPFGVVELDQMTKQLTAYGFKYNELFDMTKRLADISAATGTDVSRLALALGHVRSEAALSGYTLRQFSMGNVPLLQNLAEKFGKTTAEIRKMVSAKQISYDDVVEVLKDLTNEGGMFYNMQDVISQSVKARFKNVKDAMDIMYGEMAEGDIGEALKEVANVLMDITRNWKEVMTVMGTGIAMWGLYRAAVIANTAVLGQNNAATIKSVATFRAQELQQLRTAAMYRSLSAAEQQQIAATKLLASQEGIRIGKKKALEAATRATIAAAREQRVMEQALALSAKKLTTEDIARQVALGKLSKAQARQILILADLTAAERAAGLEAIKNTTRYGALRMTLFTAGNAVLKFGLALKSIIFNPATLLMAGVTAIIELWQRNSREMEAAAEVSKKIYERSQEALKNTQAMFQGTGIKVEWRNNDKDEFSDVTGNFGGQLGGQRKFVLPEFDTSNAQESIERWSEYIRDYAATPNRILNDALFDTSGNVLSLKEQFDNLKNAVVDVAKAQEDLKDLGNMFENAVNATNGGWFDDNVLTNIADYDKALKSFGNKISAIYNNWRVNIDKGIIAARQQDEAFNKAVAGMVNYAQQFDFLMRNQEEFATATKAFRSNNIQSDAAFKDIFSGSVFGDAGLYNVNDQKATMMADLETFYIQLQADLETKGIRIGAMSEAQQQALLLGYKDKLSSIQGLSEETSNFLMKQFAKRFGIELDVDDEKFRVKEKEVTRLLKQLSESDWNVEMNFASNVGDVIDEARKQYKATKEYFEKVKPIMLKLGVEFELGKELTKDQIDEAVAKADPKARDFVRQALNGVNEATKIYNNAVNASKAGGFSLEEEKKKGKGGGSKAYKDEFAKRWDERIRIMKEAYSWYDKWEKKVGNDAAIDETNAKYADIFNEWSTDKVLPMDFDVKEIKDYQKYVEQIRDDALRRYQAQKNNKGKNNGQEALRVYRQAVALLNDIKFDNFIKAGEEFKSIIDQTLEDLSTRWETYNKVREATGNADLALDVAGITGVERGLRNSADALKWELQQRLQGIDITFNAKMDEDSVRKMFQNIVPDDAREKIDGLVAAFKEWQKLQKQVGKSDMDNYTKLLETVVSYDAQLKKINDRLEKQKKANEKLFDSGEITSAQRANADDIAQTQADWEKMKLSAEYANLYNNAIAMSRTEFEDATKSVENMIARLKELGLISPEQAIEEQNKLDKARKEWGETGFLGARGAVGKFISGGYDGLMEYYATRRDIARQNAEHSTNDDEKKKYEEEAKHYGELFKNMSKLSDSAKDVVTAFDTLQKGLDLIGGVFDSLGMSGAANAIGDVSGVLGGAMQGASALSMLGPWGMAAGAGLGLIGGLAQVHDKRLERQIEALRADAQSIENNTSLILKARERTLGYDTGNLRRTYASQYAPNQIKANAYSKNWYMPQYMREGFSSNAQKAMYEFYNKNSAGNGYQQQLANLRAQREDYMKMYDAEADKKKSSKEAMEEYKAKIAELDDEIMYFTQDLAKELWGIDIKGWADQLSDALTSAFENGESAAEAYKNTVKSILQTVMNNMMQMSILEPMFQSLQDKLFGNAEKKINGVFNVDDPQKSMGEVISTITDFFGNGGEGEQSITAALEFMNAFERGLNNAGLSVRNSDTANTLSSSVQGTSEETSSLLAGYVNALRQDVSVNRLLLTQYISEMWPSYIEQVTNAVRSLSNIDSNVAAIRALLSENGAFYVMIDSMKSHLDNVTNGNESVAIK